ncbi:hypothetical protein [Gordonia phthalatica]|uniref:Uncharacterized protein n=1 Tax=Gordonia phthalatica TaxID=1136941 RepID=A0A0N9NCR4_9ACTN|nr:hypothetical protein [Gordonia phthalatica]ALG86269.1 hypothetical protein ACH46_19480 [Gordonia phthalatica]
MTPAAQPPTLLIAGTAGAEPGRLARALCGGGWAGSIVVIGAPADIGRLAVRPNRALLALDMSMPADEEEDRLLEAFAAAGLPTALVACCVDAFPAWPRTLAASRRRLDPDRRLAVFATAAALADEPDVASGIPELAAWCAAGPDPTSVPTVPTQPPTVSGRPTGSATAIVRADRLAGLRAGIVAARAEAASSTRAALAEVHRHASTAGAADTFTEWLPAVLDGVEQRSRALFLQRLAQVRAAALCGLGTVGQLPSPDSTAGGDPPMPPPRRRAGPEDLMVLLVGASMGFGIGRMIVAPSLAWAGFGAAGTVLSIITGLLLALWVVSARREASVRAGVDRWAVESIAHRRAAVEHWIGVHAGASEAHVSREIWNRTRPSRVGEK